MGRRLRCRIGDLAIIIKCGNTSAVGRIVMVEAKAPPDKAKYDWVVRSVGSPFHFPSQFRYDARGVICDHQLRPIRPEAKDCAVEIQKPRRKPREAKPQCAEG